MGCVLEDGHLGSGRRDPAEPHPDPPDPPAKAAWQAVGGIGYEPQQSIEPGHHGVLNGNWPEGLRAVSIDEARPVCESPTNPGDLFQDQVHVVKVIVIMPPVVEVRGEDLPHPDQGLLVHREHRSVDAYPEGCFAISDRGIGHTISYAPWAVLEAATFGRGISGFALPAAGRADQIGLIGGPA